ncbi:diguanylate cyclase (GGDEF)-like protein [Methylopila jiangsuensis]|uniref:GGDEF domain-containing protein n=1 Tax=Methylopila jiangsuensis TaxID=586230 RepID=UPI0022F2E3FB|nr:GGDEF domain-containing protein [Methylopila jiangsuensis]MDR6285086.1 diguanylate cyclase (GGDEF)-like protein [Methylopila jiangsuensis]
MSARHLERRLRFAAGAAVICVAVLAGLLVGRVYQDFQLAQTGSAALATFRTVLDLSNAVAAERGPANAAMALRVEDAQASAALVAARRTVDQVAMTAGGLVAASVLPGAATTAEATFEVLLERAKARLAVARSEVDRVRELPFEHRTLGDIEGAITAMFHASDMHRELVRWKAAQLARNDPDLASAAQAGRVLAEFRDHAGRVGSNIIAPLALNQAMPMTNLLAARQTIGHISGLWSLFEGMAGGPFRDERLNGLIHETEQVFLREGLGLVETTIGEGRSSGQYSLSAAEFTQRFVATFQPVLQLQRAMLAASEARLAKRRDDALFALLGAVAAALALIGVVILVVLYAERRVFAPLMRARREVIALAGEADASPWTGGAPGEFGGLFDAIDVLRERLRLRDEMTVDLQRQASTDALTGVLNRGGLEAFVARMERDRRRMPVAILILFDVDNFKAVNDRHGHPAGDEVIRHVARRAQELTHGRDLVARFGGDEFAILTEERSVEETAALAETLRRALAAEPVALPDGAGFLSVTASFGVASGARDWRELTTLADNALYAAKAGGRDAVSVAPGPVAHLSRHAGGLNPIDGVA